MKRETKFHKPVAVTSGVTSQARRVYAGMSREDAPMFEISDGCTLTDKEAVALARRIFNWHYALEDDQADQIEKESA